MTGSWSTASTRTGHGEVFAEEREPELEPFLRQPLPGHATSRRSPAGSTCATASGCWWTWATPRSP